MPERRSNRYTALRNRRRRRRFFAASAVIFCVCLAAIAYTNFDSPWTTASGEETSATEKTTGNVVEKSAVEKEDTERTTPDLPPPEESCDDARVLVGKNNALPADYEPKDLASLMYGGVPTYGGDHLMRIEAIEPLSRLTSDAASDGHELVVISAYRSYFEQQQNFAHFTGVYGEDAEIVSAPPGESQHQLGTTIDFTNAEVGYELLPSFGETAAGRWLADNAWRHGFIITYPDGDEQGTGRQHEPWEYRHVGKRLAKEIHESDMSLREFLTEEGVRPLC